MRHDKGEAVRSARIESWINPGATVYITGRTLKKGQANTAGVGGKSQVGSLEEACAEVRIRSHAAT